MRPTINSSTSCAVQGSGTYTSSGRVNRLLVTVPTSATSNPGAPGDKFAPPNAQSDPNYTSLVAESSVFPSHTKIREGN